MPTVTRTNATSAFTNQASASRNKVYGTNPTYLYMMSLANNNKYSYIMFAQPFPKDKGYQLISAKLIIQNSGTWSGPFTITVDTPSKSWSGSKIKWNNQPGVLTASSSTRSQTVFNGTYLEGSSLELDVTQLVRRYQTQKSWYGFRLTTTASGNQMFFGKGSGAPQLIVRYEPPIAAPTEASPGSTDSSEVISVSVPKPDLSAVFDPNSSDIDIAAARVQMWNTDLSSYSTKPTTAALPTPAWDSGWVSTDGAGLRISEIAGSIAPANNGYIWWRMAFQGSNSVSSDFGDIQRYYYRSLGTLSILSPSGSAVYTNTPDISWSLTGRVQDFYQLVVYDAKNTEYPLWDSGRRQSSATSAAIPEGIVEEAGKPYIVELSVWDNFRRQATNDTNGSQPTYSKTSKTIIYALSPSVSGVTNLTGTSTNPVPQERLQWTDATPPDGYEIVRNGKVIDTDIEPQLLRTTPLGNTYQYLDRTAAPSKTHTWSVRRIVGEQTSANNPTVSDGYYTGMAWLSSADGRYNIPIAGEAPAEVNLFEQGATFEPLNSGYPVHITSALGKYRGKVGGVLCGECLKDGTTSQQLQDRLFDFREQPGAIYYFYLDNLAIPVVIYNINTYPLYGARFGNAYGVEFEWHQVKVK